MGLIFKLLCGILALIGMCFGLNYQEISVYLCIHGCPIICIITSLIIYIIISYKLCCKLSIFRLFLLVLSGLYVIVNLLVYSKICNHYCDSNINYLFNQCMNDLQQIAKICNTTYENVNLIIYVGLFFSILGFNGLSMKLLSKLQNHSQEWFFYCYQHENIYFRTN